VRLLLDTHVALWAIVDSPKLPQSARALIVDPANQVFVSIATLWEIAIKHALRGKGANAMPVSAAEACSHFLGAGYVLLPVETGHALELEKLAAHHGDPFDRLLIAQAQREPLRLLTHDAALGAYGACVAVV